VAGLPVSDIPDFELIETWASGYLTEKRSAVKFKGLLQLSSSGHLIVTVPAALIRGLYDSLADPGLSLPRVTDGGGVRSGIVVMTPAEVEEVGGPAKIVDRGKTFSFEFGDFFISPADGWAGVSKCWHWHVKSTELQELRKTYGLPTKIEGLYDFSLIVAYRKTGVLGLNVVSKV
jgi:hypothetical protein